MQIQTSTSAIGNGGIRPDTARVGGGRQGPSRNAAAASSEFAQNLPVPARGSALAEVLTAVASNFSEEARPSRNLPRGSLVDLTV
jgi:hypothetical protein